MIVIIDFELRTSIEVKLIVVIFQKKKRVDYKIFNIEQGASSKTAVTVRLQTAV